MKLKGLGNRAYNVLFHTHTVSGIVISFALFVIFYAGAFSLFRDEIIQWENPEIRTTISDDMDYDLALAKVDSIYDLDWHSITNIQFPENHNPFFKVFGATHDTDSTTERMSAYVNSNTYAVQDRKQSNKTTVGLTIYYLHYFRQIPVIGLYLSGLVALFFLFASVTGILIHWRNLFTKFYAFVIEGKWKTIWTNAHTVLGVIGLPFQIMYAVTGAFFGLLTLILLPSVLLLYDGDASKALNHARPWQAIELAEDAPVAKHMSFNVLKKKVELQYPELNVKRAILRNYGQENAIVTWRLNDDKGLVSEGIITHSMIDGSVIAQGTIAPETKSYSHSIIEVLSKLHFGQFGGLLMRIIYFVLAMITCFMIISGVLIWRTARDNDKYTPAQRKFHHRVTKAYLAICLSMYPAFAILFIVNKLIPMDWQNRVDTVNQIFFGSWLLLIIIGLFWNSYAKQNRNYLFLGGILSLCIPLANGFVTGDWFWHVWDTFRNVAYVDLSWLISGVLSLYIAIKMLKMPSKQIQTTDKPKLKKKKGGRHNNLSSIKLRPKALKQEVNIKSNQPLPIKQ